MFWKLATVAATLTLAVGTTRANDLQTYVDREDESYAFEVTQREPVGQSTAYVVRLTSQTWQGIDWEHWLSVIVPNELEHPDKAVLLVTGGSSDSPEPGADMPEAHLIAHAASELGAPVAVLQQVPNQPLFDGLYEDALIALTFQKYIEQQEGPSDWPLLLPMTKSAVRAMDAVQELVTDEADLDVESFIVTGASKRGWTTWLTAAVDERVQAIAPMVIDVLNFGPQMDQQRKTYGGYSAMIRDYSKRGLTDMLDTPRGQDLTDIVDPFEYRGRIDVPKLVILGTNDPYWTVDSANLYTPELAGETYLYYEPNAGHGLSMATVPSVMKFFRTMLAEEPMPEMDWHREADGTLIVEWTPTDAGATLWKAHSEDRDFRESRWTSQPLGSGGEARVQVDEPADGWVAYFVQVEFPGSDPLKLSTQMTVLPESFPHED